LIVFGSDQINFKDNIKLKDVIITQKPDFVINAAAFTNVDLEESQAEYALKINGAAVLAIAIACKEINATLIH
jgi:dTDP-4-dehydrorhamnose reductase